MHFPRYISGAQIFHCGKQADRRNECDEARSLRFFLRHTQKENQERNQNYAAANSEKAREQAGNKPHRRVSYICKHKRSKEK